MLVATLLAAPLLAWGAGLASAHPDLAVAEGPHRIPPGGELAFPAEVHYHRLVGHVRVQEPAGGDAAPAEVRVRVSVPEGGLDEVVAGPARDLAVNALVRCCKQGSGWSDALVAVENPGAAPVTVDLRLALLHDGLAVTNDDAEEGAMLSLVLIFGGISAAIGRTLLPLAGRDANAASPGRDLPEAARRQGLQAGAAHAGMWLWMAPFALWGMARYGGGPVVGTLAATADLPFTGHIIVTTHVLVQLVGMVLWVASVLWWARAARRAGEAGTQRLVALVGVAMGLGTLLACALWAVEYGTVLAPALAAAAAGALPLGGGLLLLPRGRPAHRAARV